MITYKTIIQYFDSIAEQHQQIQSFTYGEVNFFDKDKFTEYPALHLTPTGTTIDDQVVVYGFDVIIFDRYNVESNKMRNEANCLSDSLTILQDLCKEITDGKYFINQDTLISMEMPVVCQPFIDTEPDNCSGWATSFNVITPNEASACLIPYFNPERQNALTYTFPNSVPTTNVVWYSRERIHNQASFAGGELNTLSGVVDTMSGNDTLTLSGSKVTWNPQKNAFHFLDSSTTTKCFLEHPSISEEEGCIFIRIKDFGRYAGTSGNTILYGGDVTGVEGSWTLGITSAGGNIGKLNFSSGGSNYYSDFPIVPINGFSHDTQHRRLEPLTICVQWSSDVVYKVWIGQNSTMNMNINPFVFDDLPFGVGSPNITSMSDFYLQELLYTTQGMTDSDILDTITWLNYR